MWLITYKYQPVTELGDGGHSTSSAYTETMLSELSPESYFLEAHQKMLQCNDAKEGRYDNIVILYSRRILDEELQKLDLLQDEFMMQIYEGKP